MTWEAFHRNINKHIWHIFIKNIYFFFYWKALNKYRNIGKYKNKENWQPSSFQKTRTNNNHSHHFTFNLLSKITHLVLWAKQDTVDLDLNESGPPVFSYLSALMSVYKNKPTLEM